MIDDSKLFQTPKGWRPVNATERFAVIKEFDGSEPIRHMANEIVRLRKIEAEKDAEISRLTATVAGLNETLDAANDMMRENSSMLREALRRLEQAAFNREIVMGDVSSLLVSKANLADAASAARDLLTKHPAPEEKP